MTAKDTIKHLEWAPLPEGADVRHLDPQDVVSDRLLSREDKRAILADWASDARAVEHMPGYRQLDTGALVRLDDIRSALCKLDTGDPNAGCGAHGKLPRWPRPHLRLRDLLRPERRNRRDEDDDDPPPAPAFGRAPRRGGGGGSMSPSFAVGAPDALRAG